MRLSERGPVAVRHRVYALREEVHVDTQFTRYREDDTPIASYESPYVVTMIPSQAASALAHAGFGDSYRSI